MDAAVDASTSQFELNEEQRAIQEMAQAFESRRMRSTGTAGSIFPPM
jgi:hypothetical protein